MIGTASAGVTLLLFLLYVAYRAIRSAFWVMFSGSPLELSPDPFQRPCPKREGGLETDQSARDKVLKQSFSPDEIPRYLDVIVIGSGIGGLSAAAILAKTGRRVLVLEQHDQAGGCCHTFIDKGFEFDVGVHYVGEMGEGAFSRLFLDQISNCGIEWVKLEDVYDTVVIGLGGEPSESKKFPIPSGRGNLREMLLKNFPSEEKAIDKFFGLLKRLRNSGKYLPLLKLLPRWVSQFLIGTGLLKWLAPELQYYQKSLSQVLGELTSNQELKAVLGYSFGDYGTVPKDAPFAMQAGLYNHFMHGGYYPRGGSSEIAYNIIPTIETVGGKVLVRAQVVDIIYDKDQGRVTGVRVKKGHTVYEILAPLVISDAGLYNTLESMLPKEVVSSYGLDRLLGKVRHGVGLLSVFVGLDGTKEELGLKASNMWAFQSADLDGTCDKYLSLTPEEAATTPPPLLFLSFPSTKDPTYAQRYPGKSTCAIITIGPYKWFQDWKDERVMHRGDDYEGLKTAIGRQLWNQVCELFPQLEGRDEYFDVGTPLSNQYYLGTPQGEVYGIDHNIARFAPEAIADLRPEIGVPGLYLTGQDVLACGISGAMFGGLLCVSAVLKRNLLFDLLQLKGRIDQEKQKAE